MFGTLRPCVIHSLLLKFIRSCLNFGKKNKNETRWWCPKKSVSEKQWPSFKLAWAVAWVNILWTAHDIIILF